MKKSLPILLLLCLSAFSLRAQQPNIIYVTPTGSGTGTQASPASLAYAVANAGPGKQVRLAAGTYSLDNTFNMSSNLTLEGGYDPATWCKNSSLSSKIIRSNQNITANPNRLVAIACTNISNFYIFDLEIETVDAVGNGVTTYGIYLGGCSNYSIVRCKIQAGMGSNGQPGANGNNGVNGAAGVNGGNGCEDCGNGASRQGGNGGSGAFPGSFPGGNGGTGGGRSTSCPSSANGTAGTAGQGPGGAGGGGGISGCNFVSLGCDGDGPAVQGQPGGVGANGVDGTDGVLGVSAYAAGYFQPAVGTNGQNGQNGRGGGGGGGGGSQSGMPNIPFIGNRNDDGPGGAGGGEGGQGGFGATGGGGGGGSFGVFVWNNGVNGKLVDSDVQANLPGNGALGGQSGGNGGNGGNGGPGMNRTGCDMGYGGPGGKGGNGGKGGVGGNGGPGQSLAIYEDPNGQPINQASFASPVEPQVVVCGYGCTDSEFNFSTNAFGFVQWFFDGGSEPLIATGNNATVHFTSMGRHTVTLVVNGLPYIFTEFVGVFENGTPFVPNIITTTADTMICPGGTSNFSSSYAGLNYQWTFTDGAPPSSSGPAFQNASSTFANEGDHWVYLKTESQACGWSIPDSVVVHVLPVLTPDVLVSSSGAQICNGEDVTFGASPVNGGTNPQFSWFVNGVATGSTGPVFTQTNLTSPITVTAEMVSGYTCPQPGTVTSLPINITVNPQPTMSCNFLGNYLGAPSTFTAIPTGGTGPYNFLWNFGDGGISPDSVATHQFSGTGAYAVTVTAIDANGCHADCNIPMNIVVAPQVVSDFDFAAQTLCGTTTVQFTDQSTGNVVSWYWDFGDGSPASNVQNPTHVYTAAGTYTVMLVASNGVNFDTTYAPNAVTVQALPTAAIDAVSRVGCEPFLVQYQDASPGATAWTWDFGDGGPVSNLQNPHHVYPVAGTYTVTLTVTNGVSGCSSTVTEPNYITVNPSPTAQFVAAPLELCTGRPVQFTDQSTGAVQWHWDFGDGNTSTQQNPSHSYSYQGNFTVALEVTGVAPTSCTDSEYKPLYITTHQTPEASFTVNPTVIQLPDNFAHFSNTSISYDFVKWNFGNGETSTAISPTTQYPDSGIYLVTLYAATDFGCSDTATTVINVLEQMSIFVPNAFTPDGDITNETFLIGTKGLLRFEFIIFDRWGSPVFSTTDPDFRWNGRTPEGKEYASGLYAYVINYQYYIGPEQSMRGGIYLVR